MASFGKTKQFALRISLSLDIIPAMKHSILQRLGLQSEKQLNGGGESKLGKQLAELLNYPDEDRLRFLAAFGGLLGRVANADNDISESEIKRIKAILLHFTDVNEKEADAVEKIILENTKTLAGLENHIYTREINELADKNKKLEILSCLFAVAAADDEITTDENESLRLISKALLLNNDDFISIRSMYKNKLSVMKNLPKG